MNKINLTDKLGKDFYLADVLTVARNLLGKTFVRINNNKILSGRIVEVEAYNGSTDEASHSFKGKTSRNEVMFKSGGLLYVYFTYGMHFCGNIVTGKEGSGCAVLLRGIEPIDGIEEMSLNRYGKTNLTVKEKISLTNGPAKICQAFGIDRENNGLDLTGNEIFILNSKITPKKKISVSKRIGIKKSVDLPWRFYINDNPFVSR
jgi:DNA-3-methyladenine glycosylase